MRWVDGTHIGKSVTSGLIDKRADLDYHVLC